MLHKFKNQIYILLILWMIVGWPVVWESPRFPPTVRTVRAATENRYASSHITGAFSNPNNAVGSTTGTWSGDLNTVANYTSRWAMDDPTPTISGTQTINILAKKGSNSGTPTIAINLYENGTLVQSIVGTTNVTSTTGQTISGTFNASVITNPNNVEIEVVETGTGGNPSTRNSAQIDYIQWVVNYTANQSPTLSISEPNGTSDTVIAGNSYDITYSLADTDNVVTAAFYYDSNNTGLDGTAITGSCATAAEGTNATCSWNTTGMTPGSYYVYGTTNDGVNGQVSAYSPGQITISAAIISVSISTDGSISYGIVAPGSSKSTVDLTDTQIAQNDSNIPVNLNIKTSNAIGGTQWTVGGSAGADTYVHEYSTNAGSNWNVLTAADSYQSLTTGVGIGNTQPFDLRITVPTSTSDYTQKAITITVQAVQP